MSTTPVTLIDSPRDAWEGLPRAIPAEVKADLLRLLIGAGFRHLDTVSFVSRQELPETADAERVLQYLDQADEVELIAEVINAEGADRAAKTGAIQTLCFPYSVSPIQLERRQRQTPEESLDALEGIAETAYKAGMEVTASIMMAFGNPFGELWNIDETVSACDLLADAGVRRVLLIDSAGLASPRLLTDLLGDVRNVHEEVEFGVQLRLPRGEASEQIAAAYGAGIRCFQSTLGGLGAAAFGDESLLGNLPTELLVAELRHLGAELPELQPLDRLIAASAEIARRYGDPVQ